MISRAAMLSGMRAHANIQAMKVIAIVETHAHGQFKRMKSSQELLSNNGCKSVEQNTRRRHLQRVATSLVRKNDASELPLRQMAESWNKSLSLFQPSSSVL